MNTIILLIVALANLITGWLTYRAHVAITATRKDVSLIEKATNSMKDALVASTAKASYLEGHDAAQLVSDDKATTLAAAVAEAARVLAALGAEQDLARARKA